jgi:HEAT repeats
MSPETPRELRWRLAAPIRAVEGPQPAFDFSLAFVEDYAALLSGSTEPGDVSLGDVVNQGRAAGRLLLCAEAGAGKSSVTRATLLAAADDDLAIARVDLLRWTSEIDEAWRALSPSATTRRMALLLDKVSDVPTDERTLWIAAGDRSALVVVDGLNEVPPAATSEILDVLDDFAARSPWAMVMVCDRLVRRALPSPHWRLMTIRAVRRPGAADNDGPDNALLLDLDPGPRRDEADLLLERLADAVGADALPSLGDAALSLYASYKDGQGRFFELAQLQQSVGDCVDPLRRSGHLQVEGDRAYFRHHLFHDVLAASAVARDDDRWTRDVFKRLTFDANSVDAVGLALELIGDQARADDFVMAVYDWNLYAAAAAVAHVRRYTGGAVSQDVELALLAVLAERRWDPVAPSVERIEDALRVSPHPLAARLLTASSTDEVVALIKEWATAHGVGGGRSGWVGVFTERLDESALLKALRAGPMPGWVAANVLRRHHQLGDQVRQGLIDLLSDDDPTVRWRAVHALGADARQEGADALLGILDNDEDDLVRYGAVRSLVEAAAGDPSVRTTVITALKSRLTQLERDRPVFNELQRALELRDPPDGWAGSVAPLIEELFLQSRTVEDQDHWRRVGRRVTESVERARVVA